MLSGDLQSQRIAQQWEYLSVLCAQSRRASSRGLLFRQRLRPEHEPSNAPVFPVGRLHPVVASHHPAGPDCQPTSRSPLRLQRRVASSSRQRRYRSRLQLSDPLPSLHTKRIFRYFLYSSLICLLGWRVCRRENRKSRSNQDEPLGRLFPDCFFTIPRKPPHEIPNPPDGRSVTIPIN